MLRVSDLDASIKYYTEALGMKLLRKKEVNINILIKNILLVEMKGNNENNKP